MPIEMLYNANSMNGTIGSYDISIEWDESLFENSTEMFNMMLQSYGIGEIKKGEIRSWLRNIPLEQAEKDLEEVEAVPY